ncbi:MAG: RNA polymerase sigma-70 factor [Sphingobacterium sp.]|jgi:RNA polymerase sigma-70 factor (ECF subfamily)|nr:RNA polymerase sigma-70 factor [Sphingobacterium sp.]
MTEPINLSDEDLYKLLRGDNQFAFSVLFQKYNQLLFIYVYKKLKDEEECRDIVQEVFLNLWNNRRKLSLKTSLKSYLYQAVRNKALNVFVHQKVSQKFLDSFGSLPEVEEGADYGIREKDIIETIDREIAMMPPKMQAIFELSRKEYLSHREIAQLLGISEETVTTQIKRALKRLKLRVVEFTLFFFI